MFTVYQTLNHVAAVPHRLRAGFDSRYDRVLVMLLLGGLAVGVLTVLATALPGQPGVQQAAAALGSALVVFAVLLLAATLLLVRPDARALALLVEASRNIPAARVASRLASPGPRPVLGGSSPASDGRGSPAAQPSS